MPPAATEVQHGASRRSDSPRWRPATMPPARRRNVDGRDLGQASRSPRRRPPCPGDGSGPGGIPSPNPPATPPEGAAAMDAISLLKNDHDKVKDLLDRLEKTTERGEKTRQELFATIKGE